MLVTAVIITMIVFVMIKMMPDINKPQWGIDPDQWEIIREREGYNKPIPEQFLIWAKNVILDGDFGYSVTKKVDATEVLKEKIPVSVGINIYPYFISIPIGFGLGIWAALRKNKFDDQFISIGVIFFISVPGFVVGTLLQYYFGYVWDLLPPLFAAQIDVAETPILAVTSRILPILALTTGSVAGLTRMTRAELTEVLTSEFMLLCRTKGLSRRQSTIRHAMRNSMVPLVPTIIFSFVGLLSGSVIIEIIYGIPGTARIYLRALAKNNYDYNLILGITAFYTIIGLFAVLLVDLSYGIVDPRIRMGARR